MDDGARLCLNSAIVLVYKGIWKPTAGEHLSCKQEMTNTEDSDAPRFWSAFAFLL